MALSPGIGRRRRWPCRAAPACEGMKKGGLDVGCLHFHVHFHSPHQVHAFSPLFWLLPHLLILPLLWLAALAFLVCFGWFTLVYFVSFLLLRKRDSPDIDGLELEENGRIRDAGEERCCWNEEQGRNEAEADGDCCVAEERTDSKIASSCTGGAANNSVHLQSGYQESVGNGKEAPVYVSRSETLGLNEKRVTRTVVVICSEYSSAAAAQSNVNFGADLLLPDAIAAKKLVPEDFFGQQRDTQATTCTTDVRTTELREEEHFSEEQGKHVSGVSDETWEDLNNESSEMSVLLLLDSVSESRYNTAVVASNASLDDSSSDEEDEHEKQDIEDNNRAEEEASQGTRPAACDDFSESCQATAEEVTGVPSTENSISQEESSGIMGSTENEDDNCCTSSEGGSHRSPLVRRSQPPWWNLCGMLEVFAGCND